MELTAVALQTVEPSANVVYTNTAVPGCASILHRGGSGLITLRGLTSQCRARFKVSFGANIALPAGGTDGPISLAIAINGEPVASSIVTVTPAAVEQFFNVSRTLFIDVPASCCSQVSVRNVTATAIDVENANLIVERVA